MVEPLPGSAYRGKKRRKKKTSAYFLFLFPCH